MAPSIDIETWQTWVGRSEAGADEIGARQIERLCAILDHEPRIWSAGDVVPPLAHWLHFLPTARQSEIGDDGHPIRGGFLPPVTLPRRMWAGSKITFHLPMKIGQAVTRTSGIRSITHKIGRSGDLVFVEVEHVISTGGTALTTEHQQIVYRGGAEETDPKDPGKADTERPRPMAIWRRIVRPDPVMLFRFSAVTFNGHRIHYDRDYACRSEGYPGLVVHGPLQATLLMDHFLRNLSGKSVSAFTFTSRRPLYDTAPFDLCAAPLDQTKYALWVEDATGARAMEATIVAH